MARDKLTAKQVEKLKKPGIYGDGGNLYLRVSPGGKRWALIYRSPSSGKRTEMGLGGFANVSLARAREKAAAARELLAQGVDPRQAREGAKVIPTFGEFADQYLVDHEHTWESSAQRRNWRMTLEVYAAPLRGIPIDKITTDDVVAVLMPIWQRIPSTAQRLRGRIERILDAARVRKLRSGENPAAWRNNLKLVMPKQLREKRRHAAMPFGDVPAFMKVLRAREAVAARCLEFLVLTAARVAEARCARWDEVDLDAAVWAIPAYRMKERREHRVALSPQAINLLREVEPLREGGFVFPGNRRGQPLSHSGLRELAQRAGISAATMHGFRASFSSWAFSQTDTPAELIELSIAHAVGDEVVRAYRRTDALERRRKLMQAWADHCAGTTNAVPFRWNG